MGISISDVSSGSGGLYPISVGELITGRYYGNAFAAAGTGTLAFPGTGYCYYIPIYCAKAETFDRVAIQVSTAGSAGSLLRLGLYAPSATGLPGTRVTTWGTVAGDSTGLKTIDTAISLASGLHWLAVACEVATCTVHSTATHIQTFMGKTSSTDSLPGGAFETLVPAGSLPDTVGTLSYNQNVPQILLRAS